MQPIVYERPVTVEAAVRLLGSDGARALAGGTDLIPQLREGRRAARCVVDLKHVAEMREIARTSDGGWRIGASVSVATLADHADLAVDQPGLITSARLIGSLQIQSRASLGGNLANGAPSADAVPLLISLGAMAEIAGPDGRQTVPVESLPAGPGRTTLAPGSLLVALLLPPRPPLFGAMYLRFTPRREMDIAIAGAGVALSVTETGAIATARITLASVAPVPLRARKAEIRLIGAPATADIAAEAGRIAADEATPISDTRGSADYRRELVAVLVRRAIAGCLAEIETTRGGA